MNIQALRQHSDGARASMDDDILKVHIGLAAQIVRNRLTVLIRRLTLHAVTPMALWIVK